MQPRYAPHILFLKKVGPSNKFCRRKSRHSWQSCKHFRLVYASLVALQHFHSAYLHDVMHLWFYRRPDRVQVIAVNGIPLFFAQRDDVWFPTLRLLHQYPDMMPKLRVDTGAIKFVLSGANIMCPGLTSKGATMHDEVWPLTPSEALRTAVSRCVPCSAHAMQNSGYARQQT